MTLAHVVLIVLALAGSCALAGVLGAAIRNGDARTARGLDTIALRRLSAAQVDAELAGIEAATAAREARDGREAAHFDTLPREGEPC